MNQSNLKKLQNLLKEKDIDIFVINRSDEFLNEYISPNAERLNFITKGGCLCEHPPFFVVHALFSVIFTSITYNRNTWTYEKYSACLYNCFDFIIFCLAYCRRRGVL